MNINLITLKMSHHASHSGYDRLADYIPCRMIAPPRRWRLDQRVLAKVLNPLTRAAGSQWYHRASLISELRAGARWFRGGEQVFHFLYGENSYNYLGLLKTLGRPRPIICSYHTPKEKFHQIIRDKKPIKRLDAVVVVSSAQQDMFSNILSPERVHFIPHGVDVEFYRPSDEPKKNNKCRCLFVGSHLRDFDVLVAAIKALRGKDIEFVIVTKAPDHDRFAGLENVKLLTGINDEELLSLYQSCDMFVMPVTDGTANNALLEAMACGAPIITTDIAAARDYIEESVAILTKKGDVSSLVDSIDYLYRNDAGRMEMGRASREHALKLHWEQVAKQCTELYQGLI